jgi:hypothetical protein
MMHYSILEQLENDSGSERLSNAVEENLQVISDACEMIGSQQETIERLKREILSLRKLNIDLRRDLAELKGEEPFRNEDYPGQ